MAEAAAASVAASTDDRSWLIRHCSSDFGGGSSKTMGEFDLLLFGEELRRFGNEGIDEIIGDMGVVGRAANELRREIGELRIVFDLELGGWYCEMDERRCLVLVACIGLSFFL